MAYCCYTILDLNVASTNVKSIKKYSLEIKSSLQHSPKKIKHKSGGNVELNVFAPGIMVIFSCQSRKTRSCTGIALDNETSSRCSSRALILTELPWWAFNFFIICSLGKLYFIRDVLWNINISYDNKTPQTSLCHVMSIQISNVKILNYNKF